MKLLYCFLFATGLVYNRQMNLKSYILLFAVILLSSCSVFQKPFEWSEELPPEAYFIAAYEADEADHIYQTLDDYLYWVDRFYNGINLVPGWFGLSEQILEKLEEPQLSRVEERLYSLGLRIGSEWPKHNEVRLLNSRSANVWRDALLEALNQDDLDAYLDKLEQDVDDLLSGNLSNDEIYFERYYEDEFDF